MSAPRPAPTVRDGASAALAMFVAAAVRVLPVLWPEFWHDEVHTLAMSSRGLGEIVALTAQDTHPPVYYWIVHGLMQAEAFGGPFASLAWLRLASLVPGLVVCALVGRIAYEHWGPRRALQALWLAALSPGLAFFAVELRDYALAEAALSGALLFALRLDRPRAGGAVAGLAACLALALYSHSLSLVYVAALGLALALDARGARDRRARVIGRAALATLLVAIVYAPWVPVVLDQSGQLAAVHFAGRAWARWRDWLPALFYYLPYGPVEIASPWSVGVLAVSGITGLAALGLAIGVARAPARRAEPDRLLRAATVLCFVPLALAFVASHWELAGLFMGQRYNQLAQPFFVLFLVGVVSRLAPGRGRALAWGAILGATALALAVLTQDRIRHRDDFRCLRGLPGADRLDSRHQLFWTDPSLLPWVSRSDPFRIESYEEALAGRVRDDRPVWLLSHWVLRGGSYFDARTPALLEAVLEREPRARRVDVSACWEWSRIWEVAPAALPEIAQRLEQVRENIEQRLESEREFSGQRFLAGSRVLRHGQGLAPLEISDSGEPFQWTLGDHQRIAWRGPDRPGDYLLRLRGWRPQPFPERRLQIRYRTDGAPEWHTATLEPGPVQIEVPLRIERPGAALGLELRGPTWIPRERLPGSRDERALGFMLQALELVPAPGGGADASASPRSHPSPSQRDRPAS